MNLPADVYTLCMLWFTYGYAPESVTYVVLPDSGIVTEIAWYEQEKRDRICSIEEFDEALAIEIMNKVNEPSVYGYYIWN